MWYTSSVSCEVLLFSKPNWITSPDHVAINMSVASLLQPTRCNFPKILRRHISSRAKYKILVPQRLIFEPRAFAFVISPKTLGTRIPLVLSGRGVGRLNFSARGPTNLLLRGTNQSAVRYAQDECKCACI